MRGWRVAGCVVAGLLAVACADGPAGPEDAEVRGVVLERDAAGDDEVRVAQRTDEDGRAGDAPGGPGRTPWADLADGFDSGGPVWSVQGERWVEVSARVLERARPFVEAGPVPVDDPRGDAAARDAACAATLHAPADRPLRATGRLAVVLVVEPVDGEPQRLAEQVHDLDVDLDAGAHLDLRPTVAPHVVRRGAVRTVACEVAHTDG
jgi:hypothetical protein